MLRTIVTKRVSLVRHWLPRDVYFWAKALLLALLAIQLARLIWAIAAPVGPVGEWRPAEARVLAPGARAALFATFDPFFRGAAPEEQVQAVTTLELKLFGVRENRSTGMGSAIIAGADGIQRSIGVGEEIVPGAKLTGVAFDYVLIDRGNVREKLFLDQSKPAEVVTAGAPTGAVGLATAQPVSGELSAATIRQGVGFAPRGSGGRITGLVLSPQGDGAAFRSAGFQAGDVAVAFNGRRIATPADLAALQAQIVPGARLSITVERGADTVPISLILAGT